MKLLVVDDDIVDRKLLRKALTSTTSYTHDITETASVEEGLAALEQQSFEVVLLDYSMPGSDGIEMIRELRAKPDLGSTAIVVVSASEDPEMALDCIDAGAQDVLAKHELSHITLNKALRHAKKRFEMEQLAHDGYQTVKQMAERDALTGLSNRYHFEEILKVMIANNRRKKNSVALLALDLDNFKNINDTLGHLVGDQVLVETVNRVSSCLRANEGFARIGGDEFAVIIGGIKGLGQVSAIAERILEQFQTPFILDQFEVSCGVSIGAAICPGDTETPTELMRCADIAMYHSKQSGKNCIYFYEAHYQAEFHRRVSIQNEIIKILNQDEFRLVYQPIYSAQTFAIEGVEALIRWPESEQMYTPDEFIPIAEESRSIESLGRWIITTAVQQLATWHQEHNCHLSISINISPIQLEDPKFLTHLASACEAAGLPPADVILEITETALIRDSKRIVKSLGELSERGFRIALDDFGTGYSSIAYLMDFPIDIVKLDKSMQTLEETDGRRAKILSGLSLMLKKLGFEVVAEGIETEAQREICSGLGLDRLQGFLMAKPMPAEQIQELIAERGVSRTLSA